MEFRSPTTNEKALKINLNPNVYGSFAEIGAGQEIAAHFFKVGAASGTIAKTISAYDMTFSDHIYGKTNRYVCEPRLMQMLDHEYQLLIERLVNRKRRTNFFALASTVEILNFKKTNEAHGWVGFRFQTHPEVTPSECVIHIVLKDLDATLQKQTIGIIGVNLMYACIYDHVDPNKIITSLIDNISRDRVQIDMIRVSGQAFEGIDNRLLVLNLVKNKLTDATMFNPKGEILQPSEALYKKNVMIMRGRFRPLTLVNVDMFEAGMNLFKKEQGVGEDVLEIAELTLKNLSSDGNIDEIDFLDRVDILCSMGKTVMISNYHEYFKLVPYIAKYTRNKKIGIVLGIYNLEQIFDEHYYRGLTGGLLESLGLLFKDNVKIYVYPSCQPGSQTLYTCDNFKLPKDIANLFTYLTQTGKIKGLECVNIDHLKIVSDNVLSLIRENKKEWQEMVPDSVAKAIIANHLFDYSQS